MIADLYHPDLPSEVVANLVGFTDDGVGHECVWDMRSGITVLP